MSQLDWLTREQIDQVLSGLSAADLIEATGDGSNQGSKIAGVAFDSAAKRAGFSNGTPATQHVRASDFKYLAEKLGEVINIDGPLSDETSDLLASVEPGD